MVTSNKLPDKKVVKMAERNNSVVVPHRTLLGEVNEHITCPLCRGYYIDATTIVECLHSFCRSCIIKHLQVKSYCPECEMMINSARPNIKPDKALQDIVYKLVPGLFQREMERRQQFYSSRPGPAASATPEQRGEDTERIIFSPEDVISFSLEYADATDTDSVSSKSSDSNEPQQTTTRRFLQCPAVVNISHLKKFISMKFDVDSTQYSIDILYKRVPLPDYYTLMDIAYIYNWKRNEPMRFFYQITDFIAIRTRYGLFDINRKSSHYHEQKPNPAAIEEGNAASPASNTIEPVSEVSLETNSSTLEENLLKKPPEPVKKVEKETVIPKESKSTEGTSVKPKNLTPSKKCDDEVEKSQFLNSFELTAKSNSSSAAKSPPKSQSDIVKTTNDQKLKESETNKTSNNILKPTFSSISSKESKPQQNTLKQSVTESSPLKRSIPESQNLASPKRKPSDIQPVSAAPTPPVKEIKIQLPVSKQAVPDCTPLKRPIPGSQLLPPSKRKPNDNQTIPVSPKTVSPLKLQVPKTESITPTAKTSDPPKAAVKKIPDLKPSGPPSLLQNKGQIVGKLRMDLLANNSDPTIDRSKILSQVKSSLSSQTSGQITTQSSGDPLKSLFDSCKINIPSSLSITLTDQKDQRNPNEPAPTDPKKTSANKNLSASSSNNTGVHKVPSPPVHNYIEILKLPDNDPKKQLLKSEINPQSKSPHTKIDTTVMQPKPANKSSETSSKGPMPSLKPISDTKLVKQANSLGPVTFQQTFEQQLLSIQSDKSKLPKSKLQVPKLMPATPKALSAANKLQSNQKIASGNAVMDNKTPVRNDNALDLSTPHNIHSQIGPQQTKAFETMQSIANLAKKRADSLFPGVSNRPLTSGSQPVKISPTATSPASTYQIASQSSSSVPQPSPRSQTRSPSSSPKLVIAEEKQSNTSSDLNINQSNQITSTQLPSLGSAKLDSPKPPCPGTSKQSMKPLKTLMPAKIAGIRQPMMINSDMHMQMQHAMLRQHMEIQNAWYKAQRLMSHQANNKDNSKPQ